MVSCFSVNFLLLGIERKLTKVWRTQQNLADHRNRWAKWWPFAWHSECSLRAKKILLSFLRKKLYCAVEGNQEWDAGVSKFVTVCPPFAKCAKPASQNSNRVNSSIHSDLVRLSEVFNAKFCAISVRFLRPVDCYWIASRIFHDPNVPFVIVTGFTWSKDH